MVVLTWARTSPLRFRGWFQYLRPLGDGVLAIGGRVSLLALTRYCGFDHGTYSPTEIATGTYEFVISGVWSARSTLRS